MQQAELAIVSAKMDCPRGGSLFLWNLREKICSVRCYIRRSQPFLRMIHHKK